MNLRYEDKFNGMQIYQGDCLETLKQIPDGAVNCCVTSPPYWGLRDYGTAVWEGGSKDCDHMVDRFATPVSDKQKSNSASGSKQAREVCPKCNAVRMDKQVGLEKTPEEYVVKMVEIFREVKRVLRDDGTLWLNLGDSYAHQKTGGDTHAGFNERYFGRKSKVDKQAKTFENFDKNKKFDFGDIKPKNLVGIPWRMAFALQDDGWNLRQDIIWCLSGGAWIYAKTQKGCMPMMIRELIRLDPKTVKLWNGEKWTQLLGISKSKRTGQELEIVLRSGERISCTPAHKFPTQRGVITASKLEVGDQLQKCKLPNTLYKPTLISCDIAWFIGLYIAEGSKSNDTIQITGHTKEETRWERLRLFAESHGCSATRDIDGNLMNIRLYGKILNAMIDTYVGGKTAKDKHLKPICWRYNDEFLFSILEGYLSGDGHFDVFNNRWRIGFTRNYSWERDLRTLCARLNVRIILNPNISRIGDKKYPSFQGEIRFERTGHFNETDSCEVIKIRKARCRYIYDLGVQDKPHLFALASGILTHNSKPNSMPESVTSRCTKSHEYIFLMAKNAKYFYDAEAIMEDAVCGEEHANKATSWGTNRKHPNKANVSDYAFIGDNHTCHKDVDGKFKRNKRSVWTVNTYPFPEAHFATFPVKLIEPCILAGCPKDGVVLDPFLGSGTTLLVAMNLGRKGIGIELNEDYIKIAVKRIGMGILAGD